MKEKVKAMKRGFLTIVATLAIGLTGCNAYQTAQRAHDIVGAVVAVAQADLPSLKATGVFNTSEGQAVSGYLTVATNLNGQYETCITNAQNTTSAKLIGGSSKFLACLSTFAGGLSDPKELAALRVMSPKAQQQAQLWVTAASIGISSVIAALGGQAAPEPQVIAVPIQGPQLEAFARRVLRFERTNPARAAGL